MDQEQQRAFERIISHILSRENPGSHLVCGIAGAGKTHLLRQLVGELEANDFYVHVVTTTAMSASLVKGQTLMAHFHLTFDKQHGKAFDNSYFRCPETLSKKMIEGVRGAGQLNTFRGDSVIVFDEISMLHNTVIEAVDKTLRFIRAQDEMFGGCCTIFGGDCLQLRGPEPAKHGEFAELTVRPVWESLLWRDMNLQVYYLSRFHRGIRGGSTTTRPGRRGKRKPLFNGSGVDEDYLNLLAEMRSWRPDSNWNCSQLICIYNLTGSV